MKKLACVLASVVLGASFVCAEPDNGQFLPDSGFDVGNFFLEATGGITFPVNFVDEDKLPATGLGGEYSIGLGYNFDGWLVGLEYSRDMWNNGQWADDAFGDLNNNLFLFKLQRVISSNTLSFLPDWLEFVPGLSLGVTVPDGKPNGESIDFGDEVGFVARAGLETSFYLGTDFFFIPFVGGDYTLAIGTDKAYDGFGGFGSAYAGIRMYPFALGRGSSGKAAKAIEAGISTSIPDGFTPDGDGNNDSLVIYPTVSRKPKSWKVEILDPNGNVYKTFSGEGNPPKEIVWDGTSDDPNDSLYSRNNYTVKMTVVPTDKDAAKTGQDEIVTQTRFRSGILMQTIIPEHKWRIVVNTIYFDANAATFDTLDDEQKQSNIETLDSIARQLKQFEEATITVAGYANNVSNTQEEDDTELRPLSQFRAEAIRNELVDRGVEKERLYAIGYGGANPIAAWEDTAHWWKNRRVEFDIEK